MSKSHVRSVLGLAACAALATPVAAATLPPAQSSIQFKDFEDSNGNPITSCDKTLPGLGGSSCSGLQVFTGGPQGDGEHVAATVSGSATITNPGGGPTVTTKLSASGGSGDPTNPFGAGAASDSATLDYYVTVLPLGALATTGLRIPLIFTDAGSLKGSASTNGIIGGDAQTFVRALTGELDVDGGRTSFDDDASDTVEEGLLSASYGQDHHLIFDFGEGDVVARVTLTASCFYGSIRVGTVTADCSASADPFVSFDQAAFDSQMGDKTFNLSDAFQIVMSPGLEPTGGVPEPASWALMIAGFGLTGAILRRRPALAA
jgi:hypothetical protein